MIELKTEIPIITVKHPPSPIASIIHCNAPDPAAANRQRTKFMQLVSAEPFSGYKSTNTVFTADINAIADKDIMNDATKIGATLMCFSKPQPKRAVKLILSSVET